MATLSALFSAEHLWHMFGTAGAVIFYGRFYVQWIASERKKQSVIPIAFWYMSSAGSLMQFVYAYHLASPGAAFGQCFNLIVYARNLIHIWRRQRRLTKHLNIAVHLAVAAIVAVAALLTIATWLGEYAANHAAPPQQAAQNWFWLGVWGVGQLLFFLRFLVQWIATEIKRRSVVPPAFWYFSLVAATLQAASFVQRQNWIFTIGMAATMLIYARNLWFIHRAPEVRSTGFSRKNKTSPRKTDPETKQNGGA